MIDEILAAFIASVFFGILFNVDKGSLVYGGLAGAFSWYVYKLGLKYVENSILSLFFAAVLVSFVSELAARKYKKPVTVFMIPGIVTLVPGALAYFTMLNFVRGEYTLGLAKGAETMFSAGAIAAGIAVVSILFRSGKYRVGEEID